MQRLFLILLSLFCGTLTFPQSFDYGNNWVNPTTSYTCLKVWEDGIYRVTASDLQSAGVNISSLTPGNLHLIYRGEEQYLHVAQTGGQLDYLDFYGQRNDGEVDAAMYRNPALWVPTDSMLAPNPSISLFSDTAAYYLYWDAQPGLRYQTSQNTNYSSFAPELGFAYEATQEYHPNNAGEYIPGGGTQYDIFYRNNSAYVPGEGYVGPGFSPLASYSITLPTPHAVNGILPKAVQARVFGASSFEHITELSVNGTAVLRDTVNGVHIRNMETIFGQPFQTSTQVSLTAHGSQNNQTDSNRVCRVSLVYERGFDLDQANQIRSGWQKPVDAFFQFTDVDVLSNSWVYDLTTHTRITGTVSGDSVKAIIPGNSLPREMYLVTDQGLKVPAIVGSPSFANLSGNTSGAQMVIITNQSLSASALDYAAYRQTNPFNPVSTTVVYLEDIYSEFGYGSPTPWAIKRFCKFALDEWANPPSFFLLWGKAGHLIRNAPYNQVPTYGFPASDINFVSNFAPDTLVPYPQVPIGRVPVQSNQEGQTYLSKMTTFESTPPADWMRNGVFFSGGQDSLEQIPIRNFTSEGQQSWSNAPYWGRSLHYYNLHQSQDSNTVISRQDAIDQGCGFIHYLGHSNHALRDQEFLGPQEYSNYGKYPLILGFGNELAEISADSLSFGEEWVLEPGRGAIAFMGISSPPFLTPTGTQTSSWFSQAFDSLPEAPLGTITQEALTQISTFYQDQLHDNHIQQFILLGDPSLSFKVAPAEVWPGDANDDRVADVFDLLPIGLAYDSTGPVRPNANLTWTAQGGPFWPQFVGPDSLNYKFIDTDGNGTVQAQDTLAISQNYGLTHNKRIVTAKTEGATPLLIEFGSDSVSIGDTLMIWVKLGTAQQPTDSLYGFAFSLYYDTDYLDSNTVKVDFSSSWFAGPGQNTLTMIKHLPTLGRIDIGMTRTDHVDTVGHGIIAGIGVVVIDNVSGKLTRDHDTIVVAPGQVAGINTEGEPLSFDLLSSAATLQRSTSVNSSFLIYPNPAKDRTHIDFGNYTPERVRIFDASGRLVYTNVSPSSPLDLEVSGWPAGYYLIEIETAEQEWTGKLIIGN